MAILLVRLDNWNHELLAGIYRNSLTLYVYDMISTGNVHKHEAACINM